MTPTEALEIAKRIVLCTCEGETFSEKSTRRDHHSNCPIRNEVDEAVADALLCANAEGYGRGVIEAGGVVRTFYGGEQTGLLAKVVAGIRTLLDVKGRKP